MQATHCGGGRRLHVVRVNPLSGFAIALLSFFLFTSARADMTWTFAVQMSAKVQTSPPRVELTWPSDPFPINSYSVHRKAVGGTDWGEGVSLPGDATRFTDESVETGKVYEYQIVKRAVAYTGFGYIAVGIQAPLVEDRGRVILVVDNSLSGPLAGEIARLQSDLVGDGWSVVRRDVSRDASPAEVKAQIRADYEADRDRTRAVFLLGRVPVLLSGNLNVDAHGSRPMPADVFYGEMNGEWTDSNGDGIYDQSTLPSDVELQVGRVDFSSLPGRYSPVPYPSEVELTKRYLDKNHAFRQAVIRPRLRGLVGNPIGDGNGQAYAASAYRNFAALLGAENVITADSSPTARTEDRWTPLLAADSFMWAFAGGAGSDFTIGGTGTHAPFNDLWASDFIEYKPKATFYLLFGSWFADWTKSDNILRTALAAPDYGLAASWSGRPHHFYHHMGVGETVGYGIRLSQNNEGHYQNQVQRQLRGIHIALMGDPTLRMQQLAPPREATARTEGSGVAISWKASPDEVLGYYVYRAGSADGRFTRVTGEPVTGTQFVDTRAPGGDVVYQVRAVALHSGASGTFFNASQGAFTNGASSSGATAADPDAPKPTDIVWVEDDVPRGAMALAEHDRWNWVNGNPAPYSGARAHQADRAPGRHHHFFGGAQDPLPISAGDTLFAYVYIDPANPPKQIMLTWCTDHWEHRAYWGENLIEEGVNGTASRRHMGPLPSAGRWVRLEVPASVVDMENQTATGMGFTLFDGTVTWDRAGKSRP
jgi:hypothetical protein